MFRLYGSVYKTLCTYAKYKSPYKLDLDNKNLVIKENDFIKNGEILKMKKYLIESDDLKEFGIEDCFLNPWEEVIPVLYDLYKHSYIQSKRFQKKSKFIAVDRDDLSDKDLAYGLERSHAQSLLEGYIMLASAQGVLNWKNDEHWFWQGDDKDLVIKKCWLFESTSKNQVKQMQ